MEHGMGLMELVQYGTPVILLGLIIANVRLNMAVGNLCDDVKEMKDNVVWKGEWKVQSEGVDKRVDRLEVRSNGK